MPKHIHELSVYEVCFYLRYSPQRFDVIVDGERFPNARRAADKIEEVASKNEVIRLSYGKPVIVLTEAGAW